MSQQSVDITPTPRILRTLGEIPFLPWQCMAELVDNGIDAFSTAEREGVVLNQRQVAVAWSSEAVGSDERTIEVADTGPGMTVDKLQNAARAGYSGNDPVNNLGLFGMGFNIATARLGENTLFVSARAEDSEWTGIDIDFHDLIAEHSFQAPLVHLPKNNPSDHGTRVVVSRLKEGIYTHLRDRETEIRRQLETVYSSLLTEGGVEVLVQGRRLNPRPHCMWSAERHVNHQGDVVPARIDVDEDFGTALFDLERNAYLSPDEEAELSSATQRGIERPTAIVERRRRLTGWLGIQRYSDPNDFGIDFIRNGRKILIGDKRLFSYENPMTGTSTLEYPIELGSTVGGRIVGELNVDYLRPTYQKNDFDRTDPLWQKTFEALRGIGPILPRTRAGAGFMGANASPLGRLVNAYRRPEPGTRNLFVERTVARDFTARFRRGEGDYLGDAKWWEAAQEADRERATVGADSSPEVDGGTQLTDNPDAYLSRLSPESGESQPARTLPLSSVSLTTEPVPETSSLNSLTDRSNQIASWSGSWPYDPMMPSYRIKVWELREGNILREGRGEPSMFFMDGIDCDFVYDPRSPLFAQYVIDPRAVLATCLADKYKLRDSLPSGVDAFCNLLLAKCPDLRMDKSALQEQAASLFTELAERLCTALVDDYLAVLECIRESQGEWEELYTTLALSNSSLMAALNNRTPESIGVLLHSPHRTLIRIVDRFADRLFDGHVFAAPYQQIDLNDTRATERTRNESKDRILSFLKDAQWILSQTGLVTTARRASHELARCSHSISLLAQEIGT